MTDETQDPQDGMTEEQRRRRFVSTDDDIEVAEPPDLPPTGATERDLVIDDSSDGADLYGAKSN